MAAILPNINNLRNNAAKDAGRFRELEKALKTLKKKGFSPISWEAEVDGQTIWIEEMYGESPRFSVSGPDSDGFRSTAADLEKTIKMVVREQLIAQTSPDRPTMRGTRRSRR